MASNRSTAEKRATARASTANTPKQALAELARHSARVQVAALAAGGKMLVGWAQATDRYAQAVADELLRRVDGETDSAALVARVTAATTAHLRELTELPRAATDHFDTRLARVPIDD